jgi:hypothetical protein
MKKIVFFMMLSNLAFAGIKDSASTKTIVTDLIECRGDVFCVDHMRDTCNARKEIINSLYEKISIENETDLSRDELQVVAMLRKNGNIEDSTPANELKKVECLITVSSQNPHYLFQESISDKMKGLESCRAVMETNLKMKNVLFQELRDSRNIILQRNCRVYLLELIKK